MKTTGLIAGSFDPITRGHLHVIERALQLVDTLHISVASNPAKQHMLSLDDRLRIVQETINDMVVSYRRRVNVMPLPAGRFTAEEASRLGAKFIFRGIRNVVDFEYENAQQQINAQIAPDVTTVFIMPPAELVSVSSSAIRSMLQYDNWEPLVSKWLPEPAVQGLHKYHSTFCIHLDYISDRQ